MTYGATALQQAVTVRPLQKAIAQCRRDAAYIGFAALMATMRVTEGPVGTACTDTVSYITVDPDFFEKLNPSQRLFILIHEVFHKWQGFFERFEAWVKLHPGEDRRELFMILNAAGDYLINHQLIHGVGLQMPEWLDEHNQPAKGLYNPKWNNDTITMEKLGDHLLQEAKQKQQQQGQGQGQGQPGKPGQGQPQQGQPGQPGQGQPGQPNPGDLANGSDVNLPDMYGGNLERAPSDGAMKEHKAAVRRDMANAAKAAKAAGDKSGFAEMLADESKKDKVNWAQVMRKWASTVRNVGALSYARPNRRYKIRGGRIQMPSKRSKVMGAAAIVLDTSGSTMGELISQVMAEVKATLRNVKFTKLYVIHCDASVKKVLEFEPGDFHKWEPKLYGGGGTRFAPAFKYIHREITDKIEAIVYHTDGYSNRRDISECEDLWQHMGRPPVLWALNDMSIDQFKQRCNFGTMMDCR